MNTVFALFFSFSSLFHEAKEPLPEINELHHQVRDYYETNVDSAIVVATQAVKRAGELGDSFGEAKSLALLANAFDLKGNTNKSVSSFLESLKQFGTIDGNASLSLRANICLSLGRIYRIHYRVNEAIEFYEKGLMYAVEATDQEVFVQLLHNQALAYRKLGEFSKAKDLLEQKLGLIVEGDQTELLYTYNQLGLIYRDMEEYQIANLYYDSIVRLESEKQQSKHRGWAHHNKGNIYARQKDYDQAWAHYHMALNENKELRNVEDLFNTYQKMAELALLQGNSELAWSYAQKSTPLMDMIPRTPDYYGHYGLLSKCVRERDPVLALEYADLLQEENASFIALQKELIAMGDGYKMDLITTNYFNKQRQQQQMIRMYWMVGCGLFFLLVAAYFSYKVWRIYSYTSPSASLEMIKDRREFIYLFDLFRQERLERKKTVDQINDLRRK